MPLIRYIDKKFHGSSLRIIAKAVEICEEYQEQGFDLTLRQLYYQFVARDILANNDRNYKRLGNIVSDARLCGYMDWNYIVDRTRNLRGMPHWPSPEDVIRASAEQYAIDKWKDQWRRVEVWIEKDALVGVIAGICSELDINYFSCRGYTSQSEMWRAARRHIGYEKAGQGTRILHLGDHDPSGIDMTRDIQDRLAMFGAQTVVERIALNMDQVEEFNPPPNPTKLSDARAEGYIERFGRESWELDALDPRTLAGLIEDRVLELRDQDMWNASVEEENEHRRQLDAVVERWDDVLDLIM